MITSHEEIEAIYYTIDLVMGDIKPTTQVRTQDEMDKYNLQVNKKSKNHLFMTTRYQLVAYKEEIYYLDEINGNTNTTILYKIESYGKTLFSIFKNHNLI